MVKRWLGKESGREYQPTKDIADILNLVRLLSSTYHVRGSLLRSASKTDDDEDANDAPPCGPSTIKSTLRSKSLGAGSGATDRDININIV